MARHPLEGCCKVDGRRRAVDQRIRLTIEKDSIYASLERVDVNGASTQVYLLKTNDVAKSARCRVLES